MRKNRNPCVACVAMLTPAITHAQDPRLEERLLVLPLPIPILAYVVKPLADGPLPLAGNRLVP